MGRVVRLEPDAWGMIGVGEQSGRHMVRAIQADEDAAMRDRLTMAENFSREALRVFNTGDRLKGLKRLHQAMDAIYPGMDPTVRGELETFLRTWLRNGDLLCCQEIIEMANSVREAFKNPLSRRVFRQSGDLAAVSDRRGPRRRVAGGPG